MKLNSIIRKAILTALAVSGINTAAAQTVKVGVSVYAGWMPYYYGDTAGVFAELGKAEGIKFEFVPRTYGETIENYIAGQTEAVVITNMDLLMGPGSAGIDSTVVVMGDYSNGNDAVLGDGKSVKSFADLKGKKISIVEKSVSEYLLARGAEQLGGDLSTYQLYNQAESELTAAFTSGQVPAVTTWAPFTLQCEQKVGSVRLFDSSKVPGEIQDLLVVNTKVLKKNPKIGAVLAKGWYKILSRMQGRTDAAKAVRAEMAKASECTLAEYDAQLKTTALFWTPDDAVRFTEGKENKAATEKVRQFLFAKGYLGNAASADALGIAFPDGTVIGDKANIVLRFDTQYMKAVQVK
jgi:NitT/TauT family transport system substrate-binding protein